MIIEKDCNMYNVSEPNDDVIAMIEEGQEIAEKGREEEKIPALVFKYKAVSSAVELARICEILTKQKIYIPKINELNDPLESTNSILLGISEEERKKYFDDYRVLSLTDNPFMPTMWAYYANNYQGVCFGFRTDKSFSRIEKVRYLKQQEMICWELTSSDLFKKAEVWQHESEYRIISSTKVFWDFGDDLVCVIFGCKIKDEIRAHIEAFIPENVAVFTVRPEKEKFKLCLEAKQKINNIDELEKYIRDLDSNQAKKEKNNNG